MRLLILDLMSRGPLAPLPEKPVACEPAEEWPAESELSMLVSAEVSADSSEELTVPDLTSAEESCCWLLMYNTCDYGLAYFSGR